MYHQRRDSQQQQPVNTFLDPGSVDSSYRENTGSDSGDSSSNMMNNNNLQSPMFNYQQQHQLQPSFNPDENFKVAVRVRPPIQREVEGPRPFVNVVRIPPDGKSITLCEHLETEDGRGGGVYSTQSYTFDRVYGPEASQAEVYDSSARSAVGSMLQGYNATLIAYGQTSTGKTYTMQNFATMSEGFNTSDENRGIVARATEQVFTHIQQQIAGRGGGNQQFQVRASYLQIYNEVVSDLLKPGGQGKQLNIRQAKNRVYVDGLSEWVVRSPHEIYGLMERGCSMRATSATRMSELSSRSHAIFVIIVETIEGEPIQESPSSFKVGKLNIVDLAGSEKVRTAGVSGLRLEETKKINWSLHELGNVISALTDPNVNRNNGGGRHIPYRNSKLTHFLTDSLGGNCKTTLIACISPALESYSESLSTLKFANRAKNIKNDATINDDVSDPRAITMKYERELKRLRMMLAEKNGGVLPPGVMDGPLSAAGGGAPSGLPLQDIGDRGQNQMNLQTWRLQERVRDLESTLQSQGIIVNPDGTLKEGSLQQQKADGIDSEEDKAQVERYKQLLLKQRDIMLNLTTRLNERDESILRLQEEIDAYDSHVQTLEDQLVYYQQNGNNNNNSSPTQTHLGTGKIYSSEEADQWIASRRVTGRDGSVKFLSETATGNPSSDQQQQQLLSGESKIRELLMGGAVAISNSQLDEQKILETILRQKLDSSLRNIIRGKNLSLQHELTQLRETLRQTEQKLQLAEAAGRSLANNNNDGNQENDELERIKQSLRASIDASTQMKLDRAIDELRKERSEKAQLATELERLSTEVAVIDQKLLNLRFDDDVNVEVFRQSVSRLVSSFSNVENNLAEDSSSWLISQNEINNNNNNKQYQEQIQALQTTIDNLRRQQQQQPQQQQQTPNNKISSAKEAELNKMLEERSKAYRQLEQEHRQLQQTQQGALNEVQQLRRSLATHTKDRRALRTILDSRIRVKVENALQALLNHQQTSSSASSSESINNHNKYLKQELSALQNLVSASISAMDADNP